MAVSLTQRINQAIALLFGGGVQLSNRNGFVDGAFANWQYGAANPATLAAGTGSFVGPVMWRVGAGVGGAGTVASLDMRTSTDLALLEGEDTINAIKVNITGGSSGTVAARTCGAVYQGIENAARYAGKSVTVQFKLKVDAGSITIPSLILAQSFGTGGSPSALVTFDKTVNWVVGTTLKKFSVRVDFPSVSTKTFGTNIDHCLFVGIWLPPGVTFNLTIAEAQIEACSPNANPALDGTGGSPTSFEHRGFANELVRVQRFYEQAQMTFGTVAANNYTNIATYKVAKRGVPALTIVGATNGGAVDTGGGGLVIRQTTVASVLTDVQIISDARL